MLELDPLWNGQKSYFLIHFINWTVTDRAPQLICIQQLEEKLFGSQEMLTIGNELSNLCLKHNLKHSPIAI